MRWIVIILYCIPLSLFSQNLEQKVTLNYTNELLANIFVDLKADFGLRFSYASNKLPLGKRVSLQVSEEPLKKFIDKLFNQCGLEYQIIGENLVIRRIADRFMLLAGKVVDKESQIPIPFAHISYLEGAKGVVTNEEGQFRMWIDEEDRDENFYITAVGFKPLELTYREMRGANKIYQLQDTTITLEEIVITPGSALQLVWNALDNKRNNLPTNPFTLSGFYRTAFKEGDTYVACLEAALDIYDRDFFKRNALTIEAQHVRKSNDYRKYRWDESANYLAHFLLDTDLIRNDNGVLNRSSIDDWNFRMEKTTYIDGELLYHVKADLKDVEGDSSLNFSADIFIRESDYAIFQVDYFYEWDPKYAQRKVSRDVALKTTGVKVSSCYRPWKDKMFLSYQIREGFFKVYDRYSGEFLEDMTISDEFFVHEISLGEKENSGKRLSWLGDIYSVETDEEADFWERFNRPVDSEFYHKLTQDLSWELPLEDQFKNNQ